MSPNNTPKPSAEELEAALWLATYAESVVSDIIETGRPKAESFIDLCHSIERLKGLLIGGGEFYERAEDLHCFVVKEA